MVCGRAPGWHDNLLSLFRSVTFRDELSRMTPWKTVLNPPAVGQAPAESMPGRADVGLIR
jgi:hypothetical protein